jgi:nicotinamide-nucleotide amidase
MDSTLVPALADRLLKRGEWLATAESCTGGLIARLLTDVAGSSQWFERGVVTYSNRAKSELLGVSAEIIDRHGAVSRECAEAMATGLLRNAPVQWTIAVTGIAGPGGGTPEKPVGLVWLAAAARSRGPRSGPEGAGGPPVEVVTISVERRWSGSRSRIQLLATSAALELARRALATRSEA